MNRPTLLIALAACAFVAACDSPLFYDADDITLRTDESLYAAGDTATLRIRNESGEPLGYNLCLHLVQRRIDGHWTDTLYGHEQPCPAIWYELEHGDSDTYPAALDVGTPPGTYRFRTRIDTNPDGEYSLYSAPFTVE